MNDPLNQLPIDPDWLRKVDAMTTLAAEELASMVLIIAVQENGKIGISCEGVPDAGPLAEMASDIPRLLQLLAKLCTIQDAFMTSQKGH